MVIYGLIFLTGLAIGSFLNVVITRLPQRKSVLASRSHCPWCCHPLAWYDNLPLLSYFWLGGRCRFCQVAIPWRYPAVELASGVLALGLWAQFPKSPLLLAYGLFVAVLIVVTVLDLEHRWIPDIVTYPSIAVGLLLSLILPQLKFFEALLGILLAAVIFQGVAWVYKRLTGRQGLGGGDVKLLALIGTYLGVKAIPMIILISATSGSLVGLILAWRSGLGRLTPVPYAPFLGLAALFYLFGENFLIRPLFSVFF